MKYCGNLATLRMIDVERLWTLMRHLDMADDAIAATSLQGKPAIRGLLQDAYFIAQELMRKGAKRAVNLGAAGAWSRKRIDPELIKRLMELSGGPVEVVPPDEQVPEQ